MKLYRVALVAAAAVLMATSCRDMDTSAKDGLHEGAMLKKVVKDFLDFSTGKPTTYEYKEDPVQVIRTRRMDTPKRTRLLVDIALPVTMEPSRIRHIATKRAYGYLSQEGVDVVKLRVWPSGFVHIGGEMGEVEVSKDNGGWDGTGEDHKFSFLPPTTPWKNLTKEERDLLELAEAYYREGLERGLSPEDNEKATIKAVAEKRKMNEQKVADVIAKARRAFFHPGDVP